MGFAAVPKHRQDQRRCPRSRSAASACASVLAAAEIYGLPHHALRRHFLRRPQRGLHRPHLSLSGMSRTCPLPGAALRSPQSPQPRPACRHAVARTDSRAAGRTLATRCRRISVPADVEELLLAELEQPDNARFRQGQSKGTRLRLTLRPTSFEARASHPSVRRLRLLWRGHLRMTNWKRLVPPELLAQFSLRLLQRPPPAGGQVLAGAVDVEHQHRQRRAVGLRLAPVALLR